MGAGLTMGGSWLGVVDRLSEHLVSAHLTMGAFILVVHVDRSEEAVRKFCAEVHEVYVRALLNPLYDRGEPIASRRFASAVRSLGHRHLRVDLVS